MSEEQPRGIIAYDLATPATREALGALAKEVCQGACMPLLFGLSAAERAANERRLHEQEQQRQQQAEASFAAAVEDWRAVRARAGRGRVANGVLEIHQPQRGYRVAECAECRESGMDEAEPVEWPCDTFTAVKAALGL
jgi:hypothetical protein